MEKKSEKQSENTKEKDDVSTESLKTEEDNPNPPPETPPPS